MASLFVIVILLSVGIIILQALFNRVAKINVRKKYIRNVRKLRDNAYDEVIAKCKKLQKDNGDIYISLEDIAQGISELKEK